MIRIEHPIDFCDTYGLEQIGALEKLLFFDIETTGFSGNTSQLYLIGCVFFRDGSWHMIQYFADSPQSEREILCEFFEFLEQFEILVHFNGETFDMPYLLKRCARHRLPYNFDRVTSFDIYKKIRPLKDFLGLTSLKQKAIEAFLGISRTDVFSGGELIYVYQDYLHSKDERLFHALILHNEDDLKGMPAILPILRYPDLLRAPLHLVDQRCIFGEMHRSLTLDFALPFSLPTPFRAENDWVSLHAEGQNLCFSIALFCGELKFFYPNYKDYYYLPLEDTAIHKSVGEFVDKSARRKATAKTCYTKKEGLFLPQFEPLWEPALRREVKDPLSFVEYQETLFSDSERAASYARQLLMQLTSRKGTSSLRSRSAQ